MISPLDETVEPEYHLDTNLDDMEGIVDSSLAHAPAGPTLPRAPGMSGQSESTSPTSNGESLSGSILLQDALDQTSSFATTISQDSAGSAGSTSGSSDIQSGRSVLSEAHRTSGNPFIRANPFQSGSSDGSLQVVNSPPTPPSPYSRSLSPKHTLPPSTQPRRPSQLRNVKMGIEEYEDSETPDSGSLQPLAPAWASTTPSGQTFFSDPFGSGPSIRSMDPEGGVSPSRPSTRSAQSTPQAVTEAAMPQPPLVPGSAIPSMSSAAAAAAAAAATAAWAAPESWGVEGDEEDAEEGPSTSDDDEDDGGWVEEDEDAPSSGGDLPTSGLIVPNLSADSAKKPPPFGYKSLPGKRPSAARPGTAGQGKLRNKGSVGRPSTSTRPGTAGTIGPSGGPHGSGVNVGPGLSRTRNMLMMEQHWIRIYRSDGSHTLLSLPPTTNTAEIINILSGANDAAPGKKVTTNMRLYLRERGQGRSRSTYIVLSSPSRRSTDAALGETFGYSREAVAAGWLY
jgi:adenylate cyclase